MGSTIEPHCSVEGAVREGITLRENSLRSFKLEGRVQVIEPMLTVTKVTKNWKKKLASATRLHVRVAAEASSSSRKI